MSHLADRKTRLVFTTSDTVRERGKYREVVIHAAPAYCVVRLAGMRKAFTISYGAIYHAAAKAEAVRARAEKLTAKRKGSK